MPGYWLPSLGALGVGGNAEMMLHDGTSAPKLRCDVSTLRDALAKSKTPHYVPVQEVRARGWGHQWQPSPH